MEKLLTDRAEERKEATKGPSLLQEEQQRRRQGPGWQRLNSRTCLSQACSAEEFPWEFPCAFLCIFSLLSRTGRA